MGTNRRKFLERTVATACWLGAADFAFVSRLPKISAADTQVRSVQFHSDIEPLVRFLENAPRERIIEETVSRIRAGVAYPEILSALMLAGVRNIQPRPVGFKFHAVLVTNSAHLASQASPDSDRWLPILWAVDQFKSSQAADVREGDWTLSAVDEPKLPSSHRAAAALTGAMDKWDEAGADVAIAALARTAGANTIFDLLCRYGMRDFRELGHKAIYLANSFRVLKVIGWRHAEPILRSLVYAQLDRVRDSKVNPSEADLPADRPYRQNLKRAMEVRAGWLDGKRSSDATREMLHTIRNASAAEASAKVVELLNREVAPESLYDAYFEAAAELVMRSPGISSLHAVTFTNAMRYAFDRCGDLETRKMILLQNAAFLPLYRNRTDPDDVEIDEFEPGHLESKGEENVEEIFSTLSTDRMLAARKTLAYLKAGSDPKPLMDAARRLILLKGRDSHDYKFSSAALEDFSRISSPWRERFLAANMFLLRGAGDADTDLAKRIRAAVG